MKICQKFAVLKILLLLSLVVVTVTCQQNDEVFEKIQGQQLEVDTRERLENDEIIRKNLFQFYHEFKRKRNGGAPARNSGNAKLPMNHAQINDNSFKNCDFEAMSSVNIIFCDEGKFIVQSSRDHSWMSFYQLPEEMRANVSNSPSSRAFKFFKRANNNQQAIMMVGLKFYIVDFLIPYLEVQIKKSIDLWYLEDKYPGMDFSKVRDCQILDDRKSYGFITWKSPIKALKEAQIEFFLYNATGRTMYTYDSISVNVAPDLVRPTDQQAIFTNHHFEYIQGSDYAWFNYFDINNNLINLSLKLPRNEFGVFTKAIIGKQEPIEINIDYLHTKPSRFARCGNIIVLAYRDENMIVFKDISSGQVEVIKPQSNEYAIGQQLLMLNPIFSSKEPESLDRLKLMFHVVDQNMAQQPHRSYVNEVHMYFDKHKQTWRFYRFNHVIQLDDRSQRQSPAPGNSLPGGFNKDKKVKRPAQKENYDKIFGILRETVTEKHRLLLRRQSVHATFLKICVKQDEYDREVQKNGFSVGLINMLECGEEKIQKDINKIQSILRWNTKQKTTDTVDPEDVEADNMDNMDTEILQN